MSLCRCCVVVSFGCVVVSFGCVRGYSSHSFVAVKRTIFRRIFRPVDFLDFEFGGSKNSNKSINPCWKYQPADGCELWGHAWLAMYATVYYRLRSGSTGMPYHNCNCNPVRVVYAVMMMLRMMLMSSAFVIFLDDDVEDDVDEFCIRHFS